MIKVTLSDIETIGPIKGHPRNHHYFFSIGEKFGLNTIKHNTKMHHVWGLFETTESLLHQPLNVFMELFQLVDVSKSREKADSKA